MTLAVEDANAILVPNTCALLTDVDIEEKVDNRLVTKSFSQFVIVWSKLYVSLFTAFLGSEFGTNTQLSGPLCLLQCLRVFKCVSTIKYLYHLPL